MPKTHPPRSGMNMGLRGIKRGHAARRSYRSWSPPTWEARSLPRALLAGALDPPARPRRAIGDSDSRCSVQTLLPKGVDDPRNRSTGVRYLSSRQLRVLAPRSSAASLRTPAPPHSRAWGSRGHGQCEVRPDGAHETEAGITSSYRMDQGRSQACKLGSLRSAWFTDLPPGPGRDAGAGTDTERGLA